MKKITFIVALMIIGATQLWAQNTRLKGDWKLNIDKTDFKGLPSQALPKAYTITTNGETVTVIRTVQSGPDAARSDTVKLRPGGGSYQNYSGNHHRQVFTLSRSAGQQSLVIDIHSFNEDGSLFLHIDETLSIDSSGDLEVDRKAEQEDGGQYEITGIYTKQ